MAGRIRTLKPEWLDDEMLASSSNAARLLSVTLILVADDHGRGRGSVPELAMSAWRFEMARDDGARASEVLARTREAIRELSALRFVELYQVDGQSYFQIRNWAKHQKVDHPAKPRIPEPPPNTSTVTPPREDSRESSEAPREGSREPSTILAPHTSDLRPPTPTPTVARAARTSEEARDEPRAAVIRAWQVGWSKRFETAWAIATSGPQGEHVATLADLALAQKDPTGFVEAALSGFFADTWARDARHPLPHFVANAAKYAAASVKANGGRPAERDRYRAAPEFEAPPPPVNAPELGAAGAALLASIGLSPPRTAP